MSSGFGEFGIDKLICAVMALYQRRIFVNPAVISRRHREKQK